MKFTLGNNTLASVAVLAAAIGFSTAASAELPARIKVGQLASITGGNASANAVVIAGVRLAVNEINKAGGIGGKPVDLIMGDDQSDPTQAVNSARRLAELEKVNVVMGPYTSQYTLAVAPVFNQTKTLSISTSGSTALTPAVSNYHFSIIPPADVQGRAMVDYAVDVLKAKTIAYIGDNGAQAKSAFEEMKIHAPKRGVKLVASQEFEFRASEITPQILSLRRANPDVLLMWPGVGEDMGLIVKTVRENNWNVKIVDGGGAALHVAAAKKVFPDTFVDLPHTILRNWTYCPNDAVGSGQLPRFAERLKAAEGENYTKLNPLYAAWAYDAMYLAKAAMEATKSVDGPTLSKWIEANAKNFKTGVSGPLDANANNHFLMSGTETIVLGIELDKPRSDGLYKRAAGC